MLIKICRISENQELPEILKNAASETVVQIPMVGELVKVPQKLHEAVESIAGELSEESIRVLITDLMMGKLPPLVFEVRAEGPAEGLWASREIYELAKNYGTERNSAAA